LADRCWIERQDQGINEGRIVNSSSVLAFAAASFSGALALAVILRKRRSLASCCFCAGMATLAIESVFDGLSFDQTLPDQIGYWQNLALFARSFGPGIWLLFSLSYSRGNYREFLVRWRPILIVSFLLPLLVGLTLASDQFQPIRIYPYLEPIETGGGWWVSFAPAGKIINGSFLVATVLILMNLERTFRSAVGTMRWRIKFLVLGLGIAFGARFYTGSQALIFSGHDLELLQLEIGALLIGCALITAAYFRSGFSEVDVYPSQVVLQTSITLLLAGAYLFVVGVLARVLAHFGNEVANFPVQAFLVLVGLAILAVLLVSDRVRQKIGLFVSRHFKRPQHDFRQIWTRFTQNLSIVLDEANLCATSSRLVSEIFNALSVSVWLLDDQRRKLSCVSSTFESKQDRACSQVVDLSAAELNSTGFLNEVRPFELEKTNAEWKKHLKDVGPGRFVSGGNRICVPLYAGEHSLGLLVLADRVNAIYYTPEEMDLLKCIGDDIAASLLNLRLTREILERKELEAFQSMSAFFIHDLKNAASTLGLTLQNLPMHFDDPAFRDDALRGIKGAADRINHIIGRLSALRHELRANPTKIDLNLLVTETIKNLNGSTTAEIVVKLDKLPPIVADSEQLGSVITNLILNARDAVGAQGRITVETKKRDGWIELSVSDNGCGMSPEFLRDSLFRPFHTTKKKGLGVGMFQTKMIVEAHHGNIQVRSEPGSGTTFQIMLPLNSNGK
jgi:putative PEP-CTERM system histidine kinase